MKLVITVRSSHHPRYHLGGLNTFQENENVFSAMDFHNNSKSLMISMNLSTLRKMIQLSNLVLENICDLFSRKDLSDSVFQDTNIMILCLGKGFQYLIKEK
jgi:hypothetical protein